jgi:alpha-beta hydrolase superfamily lysophospholipase
MYRTWTVTQPSCVVLLVHGLGAHTCRWEGLAAFLQTAGYAVFALELEGFGVTHALKGHINSFSVYHRHIARLIAIIREQYPDKKIVTIGESMGGLISFLMAIKHPESFQGLVCIAPAFKTTLSLSWWFYCIVYLWLFLNPRKQFRMPFDLSMCTRDTEYPKCMENDGKEHRLASARLLWEIDKAQRVSRRRAFEITMPVLFLLAGTDLLVDSRYSRKIFESIASPRKEVKEYPEMFHALSIDTGREKVFEDITEWLTRLA